MGSGMKMGNRDMKLLEKLNGQSYLFQELNQGQLMTQSYLVHELNQGQIMVSTVLGD